MAKASVDIAAGCIKNKISRNKTGPRMIPMREVRLGFMSAIESYNYQKFQAIQTAIMGVVESEGYSDWYRL
jgi:hypothetical protein